MTPGVTFPTFLLHVCCTKDRGPVKKRNSLGPSGGRRLGLYVGIDRGHEGFGETRDEGEDKSCYMVGKDVSVGVPAAHRLV